LPLVLRALSRCNAALDSTITSGAQPTARELERLRALRAALDIAIETWTRLPSATRQQKAEV